MNVRPIFGKHTRYARWWKGVRKAKRVARARRKDNWTRTLYQGFAAKLADRMFSGAKARNARKRERRAAR